VSIVPAELKRVAAHELDIQRLNIGSHLNERYIAITLRRKEGMDVLSSMPDDSAFGARAHLPQVRIRIPTDVRVLPLDLEGGVMLLESFGVFASHF